MLALCCLYALLGPAVDTPLIEPAIGKYVIFLSKRDLGVVSYTETENNNSSTVV